MTNKLQLLQEWETQYKQINEAYHLVKNVFDVNPESNGIRPTFELFDRYTDVLSALLGDTSNWLSWYAWDNEFGIKEMKAKAYYWKKLRPIKNLKTLLELIEAK